MTEGHKWPGLMKAGFVLLNSCAATAANGLRHLGAADQRRSYAGELAGRRGEAAGWQQKLQKHRKSSARGLQDDKQEKLGETPEQAAELVKKRLRALSRAAGAA